MNPRALVTLILAAAIVITAPPAWAARAIVANGTNPGNVTVVDLITGNTITLSYGFFFAPRWVAVTEDGRFAGVTNGEGKTVTWIDLRNHQAPVVLGKTFVDSNPKGIAIRGTVAVVAVDDPTGGHQDSLKVIAIDGLPHIPTDTEITSVALDVDANPEGVAITPDGSLALVVQRGPSKIAYVDLLADPPVLLAGRTSVGSGPFGVTVVPDGSTALVTNNSAGTLSVIDLSDLPTVPGAPQVTSITIGDSPQGIAVSADGTQAVIAEAGTADTARIVDLATLTALTVSLKTGAATDPNPFGTATSLQGSPLAVFANDGAGTVSVLDLTDHTVVGTVAVGQSPRGIAIIPNKPPKARLAATPTSGTPPLVVTLDGSASSDGGGSIVSYAFDFGDGSTLTTTNPIVTHTYTVPGNIQTTLVVTDDDGAPSGKAKASLQLKPNKAPNAKLSVTPTSGIAPFAVALDGSQSTDSDGTIASYTFTFGDGASLTSTSPTVTHTYTTAGNVTATLVVTDNGGASSSIAQKSIQVKANRLPTVNFRASPNSGPPPLTVQFTSQSRDSDGQIVAVLWDFGDGTTSTEPNPIHTYTQPGKFTVTLTATDDKGGSAQKTGKVQAK